MAFPVKPEAALASCFRNILQDMHPIFNSKDLLSFWGIDGQLTNLQKILKRIQDVLNEAERRSQTERGVGDWMDDLRELLYRVEDFVDDMNIERVRMEKQLAALNHHSPANKYTIQDIKGHYTSEKEKIVKSIKDILGKLDEVEKDANKLKLESQTILAGTPVTSFAVRDGEDIGPLVDESEIYGRQEDKDHVIELLTKPNDSSKNYSVVSIVGMGGVGKTTLAGLVFQDERVKSYFGMQSWACVSDDFHLDRVVRELIEYADKENTSKTTTAALLDCLKSMVAKKKILFVLDDMWTMEAWEKLRAVFTHCVKGSKILVTTRHKNIGNAINDKEIYELQTLGDKHCWGLFKERAFGGVVDERLERIGTKIVERCKGVPLAVKVIGSYLRFASEQIWESTLKNEIWQSMDVAKDEIFPVLKLSYHYLPSPLKRCFQYFSIFPTDYRFRRDNLIRLWIGEGLIESREGGTLEDIGCSYYIELQRRCLIQEDDKMHDLLHSLACSVSGKFFSRSAKGSESYTHMRSIRHLSLIDKKVNIEIFDEATCLRTLLVFERRLFDKINLKWTHLRVLDLTGEELPELPSFVGNLKYLRYLKLSGVLKLSGARESLPDSICELYNLQTLDLGYCCMDALPTEMGNLQNLKYLSLSYIDYLSALPSSIVRLSNLLTLNLNWCRNLTCIPDDIGDLQSLQILNLTGCHCLSHLPNEIGNLQDLRGLRLGSRSISCLPESICNIRNLQILDISGCTGLNSLPRNMRNLTCIEELGRFVVGKEEGHGIEVLKDMNKLQGELTISHLENVHSVEHALTADLKKKVFKEIHFEWSSAFLPNEGHDSINVFEDDDISYVVDREMEERVLDALEPHPTSLKALYLINYRGGRIPKWMSALSFPILKKLVMKGLKEIIRMVDLELPNSLEYLKIKNCLKLKDVAMGVPNLINLIVSACGDLTTLSISPSLGNSSSSLASSTLDHPQLEEFTFSGCFSLRDIHMMMVPRLKGLQIEDCKELKMIYADRMPNLLRLTLNSLPNLTLLGGLHPGSLTELPISSGCEHELISMATPFACEGGGMFPNLEDLDVVECPKLKFSPEGLRHLTSLLSITFSWDQLEAGKEASLQNRSRLRRMRIRGFAGQVLPLAALHTFASLQSLTISDCPELVSFPETGFPPLLQDLHVYSCKNLRYLPTGLNDHTSLGVLHFKNCDQVQARPEDGPPPNLTDLVVFNCPKLEQQIKQHRKDWLAKTIFHDTRMDLLYSTFYCDRL